MTTINHTGRIRPAFRTVEHQEGAIRLIGLATKLLAKCSCGCCLKIPIDSVQKHLAVFCPCGEQARLSKEFINGWTRVRLTSGVSYE